MNSILHQDIRATLMALLIANKTLTFKMIKEELKLSDGNLASHLKKLQNAGYITIDKAKNTQTNKLQTHIKITQQGIEDFQTYIKELEQFLEQLQNNSK